MSDVGDKGSYEIEGLSGGGVRRSTAEIASFEHYLSWQNGSEY